MDGLHTQSNVCTHHTLTIPRHAAPQAHSLEQHAFIAEKAFLELEIKALENTLAHYGVDDDTIRDMAARTNSTSFFRGTGSTTQ